MGKINAHWRVPQREKKEEPPRCLWYRWAVDHIRAQWSGNGKLSVGPKAQLVSLRTELVGFRLSALESHNWSPITHLLAPTDESGDEESVSQTDKTELQNTLRTLSSKVEDLSTCNDLIAKHGTALQRSLSELEALRLPAESNEKIKQVNERATLFRITSNAMINVSAAGARVAFSLSPSSECSSPHVLCRGKL